MLCCESYYILELQICDHMMNGTPRFWLRN